MNRLRFYDLRLSRLPDRVGLCQGDLPQLLEYVNSAQRRLLMAKEAGDEGWWGTWAEIAFNVYSTDPYVTIPRGIARLEMLDVCGYPAPVNNQFYEYLQFGAGRQPKRWQNGGLSCGFWGNNIEVYSRNNVVTYYNLIQPYQIIRIYASDSADADGTHRVLLQGLDQNGSTIYSQNGLEQVSGMFVTLASPFADSSIPFSRLTGIQKDLTAGEVQFFQVDPVTGVELPLSTMEPTEQVALYRRYHLSKLPRNCCCIPVNSCLPVTASNPTYVRVSAMAKLELIPVSGDTDYTLIQNQEAIIEECQAVRFDGMDDRASAMMSDRKHKKAIGLLNGELAHYLGVDSPAINFSPFGSASLDRVHINMI